MSSQRQSAAEGSCWDAGLGGDGMVNDLGSGDFSRASTLPGTLNFEQLAQTVERDIIPRLLIAHKVGTPLVANPEAAPVDFDESQVEELTRIVLRQDLSNALELVDDLLERGAPVASILLDLLAPSARLLGEYWKSDVCNFTEVTIGLSRLQQILRELRPGIGEGLSPANDERRILLLPAPGEQHTFGIGMVEEFFRRDGWDVWSGGSLSRKKIVEVVRNEHFDMLGLSVSCERFVAETTATIRSVRKSSCNPYIAILVGGPLFLERPGLSREVGADASAADGRQAVERARAMIRTSSLRAAEG